MDDKDENIILGVKPNQSYAQKGTLTEIERFTGFLAGDLQGSFFALAGRTVSDIRNWQLQVHGRQYDLPDFIIQRDEDRSQ